MTASSIWDNTCRLCSEQRSEMLLIFGSEGLQRKVAQKLRACLPILVYKTDPLPKQICQFCAARLDDAYEFREYCLNVYKNMHAKLLLLKESETVQIFLDAMKNSPDPCQVQLCKEKSRAPPPLVPLPATIPLETSSPQSNTLLIEPQNNNITEPLAEVPCEVQIKEEPSETILQANSDSGSLDNGQFSKDLSENILNVSKRENAESNEDENHDKESWSENKSQKGTSILEQVLKGSLTLNDRKEVKNKAGLSSQWWCAPCNNYYKTKEGLMKHMQVFCPRRYTCRKCCRVFYTVEDLAKHEGSDHLKITLDEDESLKKCHQCDREFVSWEMLRHHRLRDHVAQSIKIGTSTWCPLCNRFFPNIDMYQSHKQLHQPEPMKKVPPMVTMPIMHQIGQTSEWKKEHFTDNVKSLACPTCGKVCTQQSALSNHMRTHEPKKHKCDTCGRTFGLYIRLKQHRVAEHNEVSTDPIMTSVEQEEALNAEREAREAREARTRGRTRTYSEITSENNFDSESQPSSKRNATYNAKNSVRCGVCLQWFNDHASLSAHLITHSEGYVIKNFQCQTCKKSFKEKWLLTRHEASHRRSIAYTYTCNICNEMFVDKAVYKAHQAAHSVDRTYHCPKCNKLFFKEFSLMTHQCTEKSTNEKNNTPPKTLQKTSQQHTGTKRYKCTKCNIFFTNSQSRNSHMRIHTEAYAMMQKKKADMKKKVETSPKMPKLSPETSPGTSVPFIEAKVQIEEENPTPPVKRTLIRSGGGYRCGVCQSPFILRELAVAHLRSAHPVMPYQCPYCKKRFTTQYSFTHHIKTDHPNESEK